MVAVKSRPAVQDELRLLIDEVAARPAPPPTPQPMPAPAAAPVNVQVQELPEDREPFGRYLLAQKGRGDWVDDLAAAARKDPAFPKNGSPDEVRLRLSATGAEADMFEALDSAEIDWLSY